MHVLVLTETLQNIILLAANSRRIEQDVLCARLCSSGAARLAFPVTHAFRDIRHVHVKK